MPASDVIRSFQESQGVAFLATAEDGHARVRPMSPVAVEGNVVWMAAYALSEKMSQIAEHPDVELCYMDASRRHLRLRGHAERVDDAKIKSDLWHKHAMLKQYFDAPEDPNYILIKLTIQEALLMETDAMEYKKLRI